MTKEQYDTNTIKKNIFGADYIEIPECPEGYKYEWPVSIGEYNSGTTIECTHPEHGD